MVVRLETIHPYTKTAKRLGGWKQKNGNFCKVDLEYKFLFKGKYYPKLPFFLMTFSTYLC